MKNERWSEERSLSSAGKGCEREQSKQVPEGVRSQRIEVRTTAFEDSGGTRKEALILRVKEISWQRKATGGGARKKARESGAGRPRGKQASKEVRKPFKPSQLIANRRSLSGGIKTSGKRGKKGSKIGEKRSRVHKSLIRPLVVHLLDNSFLVIRGRGHNRGNQVLARNQSDTA